MRRGRGDRHGGNRLTTEGRHGVVNRFPWGGDAYPPDTAHRRRGRGGRRMRGAERAIPSPRPGGRTGPVRPSSRNRSR